MSYYSKATIFVSPNDYQFKDRNKEGIKKNKISNNYLRKSAYFRKGHVKMRNISILSEIHV